MFVDDKKSGETVEWKPSTNWQAICLKAAEIIEATGWCRNTYVDEDRRVCAIGALAVAAGCPQDASAVAHLMDGCGWRGNDKIYPVVHEAICRVVSEINKTEELLEWSSLSVWNDQSHQTKEGVIRILRKTAGEV